MIATEEKEKIHTLKKRRCRRVVHVVVIVDEERDGIDSAHRERCTSRSLSLDDISAVPGLEESDRVETSKGTGTTRRVAWFCSGERTFNVAVSQSQSSSARERDEATHNLRARTCVQGRCILYVKGFK